MSNDSGSFKIQGAQQLQDLLKAFPDKVKQRATDSGVRQAGARLRTAFRRAAPKKTGILRQSIGSRFDRRTGKVRVGLMTRFYYKTLSLPSKRSGIKLNNYFEQAWRENREAVSQMIIDNSIKELYREAGKIYARTKARSR